MLRSGYSSADILREVATRRMVDAPDDTSRKVLADFGASAELLTALTDGTYRVDAATAENARQAELEHSARQAAEANQTFRDATAKLRAQHAAPAPAESSLLHALQDKLMICRDGVISPLDPAAVEHKQVVALYFSAHWCAPCRKFTPTLVDYYQRVAPAHPEFEIIFVSADRSRFNWETYMRDTRMPWPAIDFDQLAEFANLKQLGGDSIPSLLVLDASGHVVASSYDGEQYVGPQAALAALDKFFAQPR